MPLIFDFSLVLVVLALVTGIISALDVWFLSKARPVGAPQPVIIEYARSFFPVILVVLLVRSFVFEPFRIPSDSMMPTLVDGDFIFVSKFSYGIRLPVWNKKIVDVGQPQRGDVVVFRKPSQPSVNYIKRLVGLPGDRVEVRGDAVWVNGKEMTATDTGAFTDDACYRNFREASEVLDQHTHALMYCPEEPQRYYRGCTPKRDLNECPLQSGAPILGPAADVSRAPQGTYVVPLGYYFFMGDNRDNSADSRFPELGFVPEANLVGKALRIWLSFNTSAGSPLKRIGMAIH
jgi:signal peptidase I